MMHKTYLQRSENGYNIEQTDAYIEAIKTEYENCVALIERLRAENNALAEKCNAYATENEHIKKHYNQKIAELDESMKKEIANLSDQLNCVYARLNAVNGSHDTTTAGCTQITEKKSPETALSDKAEAMKQQSEILEESVKVQKNKINDDISELTSRFKSLRSRLNTD